MQEKKPALGRGLSALLESSATDITSSNENSIAGSISKLPIKQIEVNPFQPRTKFEKEPLTELTKSIQEHGVIQPISVRKMGYNKYQLISGERRLRASEIAGFTDIPAYVRIADDQSMLEMALVENIQRRNLNAMEIALSFQRLLDECNITQEELADKVSKNRSTVANYIRLLKLPAEIQVAIREGEISMGHARALISVEDKKLQLRLFWKIVKQGLSVRKTEEAVKAETQKRKTTPATSLSFQHQKWQEDLSTHFATKVTIKKAKKGGKIEIPFSSDEDLERIADSLNL